MQSIFDFRNLMLDNIIDAEAEFIPLLTSEEDDELMDASIPNELPILTLRNTVLFPGVVIPITVGRDKSIKLVNDAYKGSKTIAVVSQKDVGKEDPEPSDINKIGSVAHIMKVLRMPDGNTTVIIQGKKRCEITEFTSTDPYFFGKIKKIDDVKPKKIDKKFQGLISSLKDLSLQIIKDSPNIPSDASFAIKNIESPSFLVNFIASNMSLTVVQKQEMLEESNLQIRATKVLGLLTNELQMLEIKNQIQSKVKVDLDNQQREYFLNQQMKTIQEELGGSANDQEIKALQKKSKKEKVEQVCEKTLHERITKITKD